MAATSSLTMTTVVAAAATADALYPRLASAASMVPTTSISFSSGFQRMKNQQRCWQQPRRQTLAVRALSGAGEETGGRKEGNNREANLAPLAPESPSGQLLQELLQNYPHLVPSAAEQQLEILAQQAEAQQQQQQGAEGSSADRDGKKAPGSELVLYRRIEEIRAQERVRAIEEVMYSLIVQRFIESGAPLLPKVPFITIDAASLASGMMSAAALPGGGIPTADPKRRELEAVHSPEALEMVREHLDLIMGGGTGSSSSSSGSSSGGGENRYAEDRMVVGTSKVRLGQVYAASIMYGYFLRRVDQRFQLEKSVRAMLGGEGALFKGMDGQVEREKRLEEEREMRRAEFLLDADKDKDIVDKREAAEKALSALGFGVSGMAEGEKPQSALRAYITSFDGSTLQQTATMRSRESLSVVERHTQALFGKPEVVAREGDVAVVKNDSTHVTVSTLRRLILEAIAFGGFLWDIESYVDSRCKITQA